MTRTITKHAKAKAIGHRRATLARISGGFRVAVAGIAILAGISAPAHAQGWKPTRQVSYTVPAGPGGALDQAARKIVEIAEKRHLIDKPIVIENKPGGAGRMALAPLDQHPGDPHYLSVITYSLLTNQIMGQLPVGFEDYTMLALLFGEYVTVSVRTESPIRDALDLVERLKKNPNSLSLGVATSLGNHIHVGAAKPLKAAGVDISKMVVVPYKSSQESLTNMLGGHLDVMASTTPNVLAQMQAGRIRVLAVASGSRLDGPFSSIPTWKELGVNATYDSAQGVMTSKGVPPEAIAYWNDFFKKVSSDPEWIEFVKSRQWEPRYRNATQTRGELARAYQDSREVLTDLGLATR
ncbi:Bug family tripartite tricarboxylate transporter substrate binding protein [Ottowia sp. VDI28]|uniref:Bug family tripartite tricarboxylate transporter substrate binding protein n=1 Tax=Ottowia sp. VDI28 TaxID=3133968 RepID=UPI003C2D8447